MIKNRLFHDDTIHMILTNLQMNLPKMKNICRFLLVLKGNVSVAIQNKTFHFNEYDVFMVGSDVLCNILSKNKNLVLILEIDMDFLSSELEDIPSITCNSKANENESYELLRKALAELAKGYYSQEVTSDLLLTSSLYKFIYILSKFRSNADQNEETDQLIDEKYQARIYEIKRYIKQNYNKQITMNDLAAHLYLTPQYTSKYIKQHLGVNFVSYVNSIRLNHAVKELLNTNNSITQLAFNNGYPNLTAFNKAFRDVYKETPMKYRNHSLLIHEVNSKEELEKMINISSEEHHEAEMKLEKIINKNENVPSNLDTKFIEPIFADVSDSTPLQKACFEIINLGFAVNILSNSFQKQLATTQSELNFKYARFQGIIEPDIIDKIPNTNQYNFSKANRIIDFLYSINLLPFIEIGTKPRKVNISSNDFVYYSDNRSLFQSLDEWKEFTQGFINNCINRYGIAEVEKWKFELWLPHGKKLEYTKNSVIDFIEHYEIIYKTFKKTLPKGQVGGFGYNISTNENILQDVIHSLTKRGIVLDFLTLISFHLEIQKKDETSPPYFTTNSEYLSQKITYLQKQLKQLVKKEIPIILAEWNFDYTSRNYVNDSIFKALFITKNILENTSHIQAIGYWLLSDITSEYKDTNKILFGGNGLITVDGIKKPAYFAYQFLSKLGGDVIKRGNGYIITTTSRDTYQILLYNYNHPSDFFCFKYDTEINIDNVNDIFEQPISKEISIDINNISKGNYRVKTYSLNKDHGSILDEWIKMGAIQNITPIEINYFNSITVPSQNIYYTYAEDTLRIQDTLSINEIHLITINLEV